MELTNEQLEMLEGFGTAILQLVFTLRTPLVVSEEVRQRVAVNVAARTCLDCGKPWDEKHSRGLCASCFQKAQYGIRQRKITESQLIVEGYMTEESKRGKSQREPTTKIEKLISAGVDRFRHVTFENSKTIVRETKRAKPKRSSRH